MVRPGQAREKSRQTDRQADRQTYKRRDGQMERQTA